MDAKKLPTSYAQYGQDLFVVDKLDGRREGTFIEIGAFDGLLLSNTALLEREYGWRGICIEPLPAPFAELQRNRTCITVRAAVTDVAGEQLKFEALSGPGAMLSGLQQSQARAHRRRIEGEMRRKDTHSTLIDVPTVRAADVLRENAMTRVDFASIDVEGGELKCLKGLLDDDIEVGLICIENNYGDSRVHRLLKSRGFLRIARIGSDDVYRRALECTQEDRRKSRQYLLKNWRMLLANARKGLRW